MEGKADTGPGTGCGTADSRAGKSWEKRLDGETAMAFRAFSLYRSMGFRRSIKGCLELHGLDAKKYGSWSRWSRLYDWTGRAAAYDEHCAEETEKQIIAEHVERKKHIMDMLGKFDALVDRRLGTLEADRLDAGSTMDLLERSAKLGGYISGTDGKAPAETKRQLEINFVDGFDGV